MNGCLLGGGVVVPSFLWAQVVAALALFRGMATPSGVLLGDAVGRIGPACQAAGVLLDALDEEGVLLLPSTTLRDVVEGGVVVRTDGNEVRR